LARCLFVCGILFFFWNVVTDCALIYCHLTAFCAVFLPKLVFSRRACGKTMVPRFLQPVDLQCFMNIIFSQPGGGSLCCGLAFSSRGMLAPGDVALKRLVEAIEDVSGQLF
jgi:hypothetical protein